MRRVLIDHLELFTHLRHEIRAKDLSERHDVDLLDLPVRSGCLVSEGQLISLGKTG
jgi:hypothetical protein